MSDLPTEEMIEAGKDSLAFNNAETPEECIRLIYLAMKAVEPDGWEGIEATFDSKRTVLTVSAFGRREEIFLNRSLDMSENGRFIASRLNSFVPPSPEGV
jgi:hypothetical protein